MADNYLEKKMEEHRRAPSPALPRRYSPLGVKAGTACLPFGRRRILVCGLPAAPEAAEAAVRALGATGSTVFFLCDDLKRGRALSQATSTRHIPLSDNKVEQAREIASKDAPLDFEIALTPDTVLLDGEPLITSGSLVEAVTEWLVYLLLPQSRQLGLTLAPHKN